MFGALDELVAQSRETPHQGHGADRRNPRRVDDAALRRRRLVVDPDDLGHGWHAPQEEPDVRPIPGAQEPGRFPLRLSVRVVNQLETP